LDWQEKGDASAYNGLFLTFDTVFPNGGSEADITSFYRPRPGFPFTAYEVAGKRRLVWTTFMPSQVDVDIKHEQGKAYLVSSVATDDNAFAERVREESQAFKFGINKPRSRGDKAEVFGGKCASWRDCFVGGDLLVESVTTGEGQLFGNFADGSRYPINP
jgi:hypothetical protein